LNESPALLARRAALETLRAVRRHIPFADAWLPEVGSLSDADRRLAYELAAGVLRERRTLDRRIRMALTHPDRPLDPDIADLLRLATYQLTHLDRVPDFAAVDTAVALTRSTGGAGAGAAPFVNAVLRRIVRERGAVDLPAGTLAEEFSHPDWLVARWIDRLGEERTRQILAHNNRHPVTALHPARWTLGRLREAFQARNVPCRSTPDHLVVTAGRVADLPGYDEGAFFVQNPTQRHLLRSAALPPGVRVWDACAAPGGKTAALAVDHPVIASDVSRARVGRLRANLDRLRLQVPVFLTDAGRAAIRPASISVVLLDAPCSATGAMARHPDARWRLRPDAIARLAARQARLLDHCADMVQPGGVLVYLTCSLEHEENGGQIDRFLERDRRFERSGEDLTVFPSDSGADGGFAARVVRKA